MEANEISRRVREYLLSEVLAADDHERLGDDTPLVTSGVLDSIATLNMVCFLEETFGVSLAPHEVGTEHLNTTSTITALVRSKLER